MKIEFGRCACYAHHILIALISLTMLLSLTDAAHSNTASPYPVSVKQPDGSTITLFLRGTARFHWYEHLPETNNPSRLEFERPDARRLGQMPGFTVIRDENGQYVYATKDTNGDWAPTPAVVGKQLPPDGIPKRLLPDAARIQNRMKSVMPKVGTRRRIQPVGDLHHLVVLLRFKDHHDRALPVPASYDDLFKHQPANPPAVPSGTVAQYFAENSYGKLRLTSTVSDWIVLPKTEKEYAAGNCGLGSGMQAAIKDALDILNSSPFEFANFDRDGTGRGDGHIDAVTFIHSGYGAEWGGVDASGVDFKDRIWSHQGSIDPWTSTDGVTVSDYIIATGLWDISGTDTGHVGVFCHELGHLFGLPGLYDVSGQGYGAGTWCLMSNCWGFDNTQLHPPHLSAWSKIFLGWNKPISLSSANTYTIRASTINGSEIYRVNYPDGNVNEYLLIENRQPLGKFEKGIPAGVAGTRGGLAIWHIDDSKLANNEPGYPSMEGWPANGRHYTVSLLQADGRYDLEHGMNYGDGTDLFRAGYVDALTSTTVPTSSSYAGFQVPPITEISVSGEIMTFKFGSNLGLGDGISGNSVTRSIATPTSASKACNSAAFDALLEVITSKTADDTLRISAMRMAGKIVRVEKDKCEKLSEALAQVIEDDGDKAAIRSEAIATVRHLAK